MVTLVALFLSLETSLWKLVLLLVMVLANKVKV